MYTQSTCTLTNDNSADITAVHVQRTYVKLLRVMSLSVILYVMFNNVKVITKTTTPTMTACKTLSLFKKYLPRTFPVGYAIPGVTYIPQ